MLVAPALRDWMRVERNLYKGRRVGTLAAIMPMQTSQLSKRSRGSQSERRGREDREGGWTYERQYQFSTLIPDGDMVSVRVILGQAFLGAQRTGRVFVDVLVVEYGANYTECTSTWETGY